MNCQTCQFELEDFLYGELDAPRGAAIREHLSVCADCRVQQAILEKENELFATYYEQTAIEPADEMWQAIHARIQGERPANARWHEKLRGFFLPLLAPALVRQIGFATLLILLSASITAIYFSRRGTEQQVAEARPSPTTSVLPPTPAATPEPNRQATPPPAVNVKPTPTTNRVASPPKSVAPKLSEEEVLTQQIARATREYQGAIKLLERTIAKRKPEFDEGALRQFESSLAMIDASIAASRKAMQEHPNDPTAARYLLAAYSKKVELMQEIAMR